MHIQKRKGFHFNITKLFCHSISLAIIDFARYQNTYQEISLKLSLRFYLPLYFGIPSGLKDNKTQRSGISWSWMFQMIEQILNIVNTLLIITLILGIPATDYILKHLWLASQPINKVALTIPKLLEKNDLSLLFCFVLSHA